MRDVFNALLEAELAVEVELGNPSVPDLLSETLDVKKLDEIEESLFHQSQQRAEESIFTNARRMGAVKTLAQKGEKERTEL